ncbi:MAG: hypothetical protein QG597_638 [Actinomycetota bacterium]|nr:hypothetical protein [Actinomycetota bacterium]
MSATEKYRSSNAADRLLHPNSLDSYLLGSRDVAGMRTGDDGAITILVQHDPPGTGVAGQLVAQPGGCFQSGVPHVPAGRSDPQRRADGASGDAGG